MYYPLSQITTDLYSNNEYAIKSTGIPYTGPYWKNSKGQFFTGKTPQDSPIEELTLISTPSFSPILNDTQNSYIGYDLFNPEVDNYNYIKNINNNSLQILPTYLPVLPTQQDYQLGEFRRYFCKKTNENIYLEISKDIHNKLTNKDTTIAYQYYFPFSIPWKLTGDKSDVHKVNYNIVELTMKQQKLSMFDLYIKRDYTKYYQET